MFNWSSDYVLHRDLALQEIEQWKEKHNTETTAREEVCTKQISVVIINFNALGSK